MRNEIELNEAKVQGLAHDALVLAAAAVLWTPITERRVHQAANRVSRLLLPAPKRRKKRDKR